MKKGKKLKLALNKQIITRLDNESLKKLKGGKEQQFLSIFHCSRNIKCLATGPLTEPCGPVSGLDPEDLPQ